MGQLIKENKELKQEIEELKSENEEFRKKYEVLKAEVAKKMKKKVSPGKLTKKRILRISNDGKYIFCLLEITSLI
jgi:predicted RNase H-like nuclease (RuvC/YqgF family)